MTYIHLSYQIMLLGCSGTCVKDLTMSENQWCGLRTSVLGQDRSETKKSVLVLVLHALVLVLQILCYAVKHSLVTLVVIMILEDTAALRVLFLFSLFCAWNITTVEINGGVHLLKG